MKRIYKAINEGLNKRLIDFNSDRDFKKSLTVDGHINIKKFKIGDYVYKDIELGYNNYIGEKIAICVNDEPDKELYVVLDNPLLHTKMPWAKIDTYLYVNSIEYTADGWLNTLMILNSYKDDIEGTIWEYLNINEYIPSEKELKIIYNNCKHTELWDIIGLDNRDYWTTSLHPGENFYNCINAIGFYAGNSHIIYKNWDTYAIKLLHIN